MQESKQSWATATDHWEEPYRDWEVMAGQSVPLDGRVGEERSGFMVVLRQRDTGQELHGIGEDVVAALAHLNWQGVVPSTTLNGAKWF